LINEPAHILVIDDNRVLLRAVAKTLDRAGYEVKTTDTGNRGLELVRSWNPDLVLLDVVLPDGNGIEICQRIKADPQTRDVYVILLSGLKTDSKSQAMGLEAGADGYLTRPVSNRELRARVDSALRLKKAHQALRESEANYRQMIELAPMGVFQTTSDGRVLKINKRMAEMLGYESKEETLQVYDDLAEQLYVDSTRRQSFLDQLEQSGQVSGFEFQALRRDGSKIWISMNARVSQRREDSIFIIEGFAVDVTDRKRTEAMLRESRDQFEQAIKRAPIPMVITDSDQDILHFNDKFIEEFGYTLDDVSTAEEWWRLAYPAEEYRHRVRDAWEQAVARAVENDSEIEMQQWDLTTKDGSVRHVEFKMTPLGEISLIAMNDITERLQAEQELYQYQKRLEDMVGQRTEQLKAAQGQLIQQEKLSVLGQMAGGIGHELRQPLGTIKNVAYYLNMVLEDVGPKIEDTLETLGQEIDHSEAIIDSLLNFARTGPPNREQVRIEQLVHQTVTKLEIPSQIDVRLEVEPDLPSLMADPDQLRIVFRNLFENALQAMPEGGRVTIAAKRCPPGRLEDADCVLIAMSDTGIGIPPKQQEKLFEPLFTTKAKGIGLGLALVKMLVEGHGGTIEVQSSGVPGQGATFTLMLPTEVLP
jgi:PAS domain S-box-containing protein